MNSSAGIDLPAQDSVQNQCFPITATNSEPSRPIHVYQHCATITDCRSGTCLKAYLYWNGYIPPTQISGDSCAGTSSKVVSGLPTDYVPYQTPLDDACGGTGISASTT